MQHDFKPKIKQPRLIQPPKCPPDTNAIVCKGLPAGSGFIWLSIIALTILCILALTYESHAKPRLNSEKYYQEKFCNEIGGVSEIILNDMTRVDCIANGFTIEVDFANKWYEAIGQSLYYAMKTKMKPGIALIIESKRDCVYYKRMLKTIKEFDLPYNVSTRNIKEFNLPLELPTFDIKGSLYTINGKC